MKNIFLKNNNLLVSNKYKKIVTQYLSGISASTGSSGATDPTTQGWTYDGAGSGYSDAYDSGNGGWRTVDGTGLDLSQYYINLSTPQASDINNKDWQVDYRIAIDKDAIQENGTTVLNYYLAPNNSRQNNIGIIVRTANTFNYALVCRIDSGNQIQFANFYNSAEIYGTGFYIGGVNPFPKFLDCSLRYNKITNIASIYVNNLYLGNISNGSNSTQNRVYFGCLTSTGQGSAIWNYMSLKTY